MKWGLLSSLSADDVRDLLDAARRRSFARGEVIVREGDPADSLHLLAEGRVAIRISTSSGETATLNVLGPGDYFGELALVRRDGDRARSATVTALEPATTLVISAATFRRLCEERPAFDQVLVSALALRVEELSSRLLDALHVALDRRLYRCLLDLVQVYGTDVAGATNIPLTQEDLASLVGGTRPSVNKLLQELSADDVIEVLRGHVIIRDADALGRKAV